MCQKDEQKMAEDKELQEKMNKDIESFCDKVRASIPVGKLAVEDMLMRMFSVGWINQYEYNTFVDYINREED